MNILITIVKDKANYSCMTQLSHIVGELGHDPLPMTMTQLSHIVAQLSLCGRDRPWHITHDNDPALPHSGPTLPMWER